MVKRIAVPFAFVFLIFFSGNASGENFPVGGRSAGMSNATVALNDFWAIQNNQAGLASLKNMSAGIFYENRFGLKELAYKSGAFIIPTNSGVFGLSMNYFGYTQYNESKTGIAYAKSFGKNFSAGIQLDYLATHIAENYGKSSVFAAEIGLRYQINKNLAIGTHIFNPTKAKVVDYNNERIPTLFKLGLAYSFSDKIILAIESEKDIQYDPVFKTGIEYHPIKQLYFRTGISTNPVLNSFGFGLEYSNFNLDFAAEYHRVLGFTPAFSLIFHVNKKNQMETKE